MSAVDAKPVETAPPAAETKKTTTEEQITKVKDTLNKKGLMEKLKSLIKKKIGVKKTAAPKEETPAPAAEPTPAPAPAAAA